MLHQTTLAVHAPGLRMPPNTSSANTTEETLMIPAMCRLELIRVLQFRRPYLGSASSSPAFHDTVSLINSRYAYAWIPFLGALFSTFIRIKSLAVGRRGRKTKLFFAFGICSKHCKALWQLLRNTFFLLCKQGSFVCFVYT